MRSAGALFLIATLLITPDIQAQEEVTKEGYLSLQYCGFFPMMPYCLLQEDGTSDTYWIIGDISTTIWCLQFLRYHVSVVGTLSFLSCDPIEPAGGPGIHPLDITKIPPWPVCGDANGDREVGLSDSVWTLMWLFSDTDLTVFPGDEYVLDVNGDGEVDVSDPIYILSFLFLGGSAPRCPEAG